MNAADQIRAILASGGIATKHVWFGGQTGTITFYSRGPAEKAAILFKRATFRTRGPVETIDYAAKNEGTCLNPSTVRVWRLGIYLSLDPEVKP